MNTQQTYTDALSNIIYKTDSVKKSRRVGHHPNGMPIQSFDDRYVPVTETGCWLWTGGTNRLGYGVMGTRSYKQFAHRYSWMIHYGEIPKGMVICHKCDTPQCVNPKHLFIGTPADNIHDMLKKGRGRHQRATLREYS